jgi:hypothetical protein
MALGTYNGLLAACALWANRNDLGTVLPDCVVLAESDLNKRLRTPFNESQNTAFAVTGRYTTLPTDFAEMRKVILNDGSIRPELVPLPQSARISESGVPRYYNLVNNTLEITPLSTAYTLELSYYKKVPALASNLTNDVLTNFPDVYLFGTLVQVGYFMDDAQMVARFEPKYEQALSKANATRFRQFGTGLQVRVS